MDAAKVAAPQVEPKKDDLVVQQWATLPDDGSGMTPTSKEDQETQELIDRKEKLIEIYWGMAGEASTVKNLEEEIAKLKKKPPANSIAKDHVTLARVAKDAE